MSENRKLENVCVICLSQFTEPKILPCFHTFCVKCLETNVSVTDQGERFSCPTCRTVITIPTGGVKCFQTNFYVATNQSWQSNFDCDACGVRKTARFNCKECDQNFCENCSKVHQRMSSSKEHNLVQLLPVEASNSFRGQDNVCCSKHPCEQLALMCKECNELLCQVCKETEHIEHMCSDVTKLSRDIRQELIELIEQSEENLREIRNDIRVVERQAETKHAFFDNQIASLRTEKDALLIKINEKFKNFEGEVKRLNDEQKMLINELINDQKLKTSSMSQTIDQSRELIEVGEDIRVIKNFDNIKQKLGEIKMTLTPVIPGHNLMARVQNCSSWLIQLNEQNSNI